MIKSFGPIISENTKQMVIGSMPGAASLAAGQYYAYKQNAFWRIVFDTFEHGRTPLDYADKLNTLLKHNTGLWDTLAACNREGSLDSNIKCAEPNNFKELLQKYKNVKKLIFNGQAAYKYFFQHFGQIAGIIYIVMPSTSPAYAGISYKEKLELWRKILYK